MDRTLFSAACARAVLRKPEGGGIGMLGEKSLHSALKYYYEPDETCHEREVLGFFADVKNSEGVTEIQTRNLYAVKRKLAAYLEEYRVTLVHPIVRERRLIYLDPETGELSRPRLSPKRGRPENAFSELVHIREALGSERLRIILPVVDAEEYRVRGAGKRRRRGGNADLKYELLPTALVDELVFDTPRELISLLPEAAPESFTAAELAKAGGLPLRTASAMCAALVAAGALERRRQGRAYIYFSKERQ